MLAFTQDGVASTVSGLHGEDVNVGFPPGKRNRDVNFGGQPGFIQDSGYLVLEISPV